MNAKVFGLAGVALAAALVLCSANAQENKAVGALPPHPFDGLFEKKKGAGEIVNGLLNDPLFKKAVQAAVKARSEAEESLKKQPNLIGVNPSQAARVAFLQTLSNGKED